MISVVVLTKNEEKNITDCIETLSWCDEVIVVDDSSEDRTREIARNLGAKVFVRSLSNDFSAQRNYGLSKAKGEWFFFVDADERVTPSLRKEIIQSINNSINKFDGFYIKRRDFMWGKELRHGETGNTKLLRLGKRKAGEWEGKVHEEWRIKGKTVDLGAFLNHYPHQTISEFLREINYYTNLRAQELYDNGVKSNFLSIIIYAKGKFIQSYFLKLGFLDGVPGLIHAITMSFHSFLVRGKLWALWRKS